MVSQQELAGWLASTDTPGAASEFHGALCGVCCGVPDAPAKEWLDRALSSVEAEAHPTREACARIAGLATDLRDALTAGELDYALVLPEESEPLAVRAGALARWCEGFLYGLALADAAAMRALTGDAREALEDLAAIARTAGSANDSETDEEAYEELVEFVRIAVQLVFYDLARRRARE
jgi:yecA family protein